ncbi:MAG: helix-turn-helix domain-containing protein [Deltaproteobacteria bacterium]|jgi:AraC-like DNA-binding protein|nr:helix-turn-helix domain-containing protein [Deltaproteobacteria bacterium]
MEKENYFSSQAPTPKQPGMTFQSFSYTEAREVWNPLSAKGIGLFFQIETGPADKVIQLVPDCCFDIIFCFGAKNSAHFFGPLEYQTPYTLRANCTYFGFRPYSITSMKRLKVPPSKLVHSDVDFDQQFSDLSIIDQMQEASTFKDRIRLMIDYAGRHMVDRDYKPGLVEHLELSMCRARGALRLERLAERTGYTERHCRGSFKQRHGFSMKYYANIMRFQHIVRLLTEPQQVVPADVVFDSQMFDQSHLIHEFKKYTCHTPGDFRQAFSVSK